MNYRLPFMLIGVASAVTLHAETPFEREFKQLREQRDKTVAAAIEPINRKYRASLEVLLRRATQGNDLETAIKIKEGLASAGDLPAAADTAEAKVLGEWHYEEKGAKFRQIFLSDGRTELWQDQKPALQPDGANWYGQRRWKAESDGIGIYVSGKGKTAVLVFKDNAHLVYKTGPDTGRAMTRVSAENSWRTVGAKQP